MTTKATPPPHSSISVPYRSLVRRADPHFDRANRHQLEHEFSNGRQFYADPSTRGANNPTDNPVPPGNAPGQVVSGPYVVPTQPPVANPDTATTPYQTAVTILPLANDTDPGGFSLSITSVSVVGAPGRSADSTSIKADSNLVTADATPAGGSATTDGHSVLFTPLAGYFGAVVLNYTISNGVLSASSTITVTVQPSTPPAAPTGLAANSAGLSSIVLSIVSGDTALSYKIERRSPAGSGSFTQIAAGASMPFTDTVLSPNTQYEYRVRGTNAFGDSAYSAFANATTDGVAPNAPTGLTATSAGSAQINLSISSGDTATSFKVERRSPAGSGSFTQIASGVSMPYADTGLSPTTQYEYRIRGTNAFGDSPYSTLANATTSGNPPLAPTGLTATGINSSQINLAISSGDTATSFKVERRSPAGSGSYTQIAAGVSMPYSDTGLATSTQYEYRVRGTNAYGDSLYSSSASATTLSGGGGSGTALLDEETNAIILDEETNAAIISEE